MTRGWDGGEIPNVDRPAYKGRSKASHQNQLHQEAKRVTPSVPQNSWSGLQHPGPLGAPTSAPAASCAAGLLDPGVPALRSLVKSNFSREAFSFFNVKN